MSFAGCCTPRVTSHHLKQRCWVTGERPQRGPSLLLSCLSYRVLRCLRFWSCSKMSLELGSLGWLRSLGSYLDMYWRCVTIWAVGSVLLLLYVSIRVILGDCHHEVREPFWNRKEVFVQVLHTVCSWDRSIFERLPAIQEWLFLPRTQPSKKHHFLREHQITDKLCETLVKLSAEHLHLLWQSPGYQDTDAQTNFAEFARTWKSIAETLQLMAIFA